MLFLRLGEANDMRTSTQSAADAAALAAAGDIQHRVAQTIADGSLPWGSAGGPAAERPRPRSTRRRTTPSSPMSGPATTTRADSETSSGSRSGGTPASANSRKTRASAGTSATAPTRRRSRRPKSAARRFR
ncbi:hypothetical protein ACFQXA_31955 [Nocardiopsis composta]